MVPCPVMTIPASPGSISLAALRKAIPSMPGMVRSVSTMSNAPLRSSPSAALAPVNPLTE